MERTSNARTWLVGFAAASVLVIGIITVVRSGNDPSEQRTESEEVSAQGCDELLDFWPAPGSESDPELPDEEWGPMALSIAGECAGPTGAVIVVEGLPDVSGVYSTADGDVALTGMGGPAGQDGDREFAHGRCFVGNPGENFQTKATYSNEADGLLITIDVGVSGSGEPFVAVVRENLNIEATSGGDSGILSSEVTHDYQAARFRQNAVIEVDPKRTTDQWAGVATFGSTFYNIRDYFPHKEAQWEGTPLMAGRVSVFCGTGTADG